jgi:tetratricopeptide (TPR) repeat protein
MYIRHSIIALAAIALVSCSRDPNYLKQKYLESGNKYFEQKRYKEASLMYRKSELTDRKFGPAYYRLALVYLQQGQIPNAYPQLRRAVELLPPGTADADDATLKMCEIMLMAAQSIPNTQGLVTEVQPLVEGLIKRNASSWQGHKLRGDLALLATRDNFTAGDVIDAKRNLTVAIQEYRTALNSKPGDYIITLALARTLAKGFPKPRRF